jgi:PAT family beta-lactamase induction signal transducer AmpG
MQTIKDLSQLLGVIQRITVVFVLGFASGLPLALTGGSLQAWLTLEGMDLTTI